MKLNQKGYMLVEIIIAAVLTMTIAFYLLNLTYKFKNTDEDIYQSITYLKDKIVLTKNIMNDLARGKVSNIKKSNNEITFDLTIQDTLEPRKLEIIKNSSTTTIKYGKYNNDYDTKDVSYYKLILDKTLVVGEPSIDFIEKDKSIVITIPITSLYKDENYDIKLLIMEYQFEKFSLASAEQGKYVNYSPQISEPSSDIKWRIAYINDDRVYLISEQGIDIKNPIATTTNGYEEKNVGDSSEDKILETDAKNYYWSDSYQFNQNTGKFKLTGDVNKNFSVGKYTCKSTQNQSCDNLYKGTYLSMGGNISVDKITVIKEKYNEQIDSESSVINLNNATRYIGNHYIFDEYTGMYTLSSPTRTTITTATHLPFYICQTNDVTCSVMYEMISINSYTIGSMKYKKHMAISTNIMVQKTDSDYIQDLNKECQQYCNPIFSDNCEIDSRSINADDYNKITSQNFSNCINYSCKINDLIDNLDNYWFASLQNEKLCFWTGSYINCSSSDLISNKKIRPIIKLKANINVINGSGTKEDPYIIEEGT